MPTYEYECKNCGHEFEIFQSMKDSPLKKCPKCKKLSLKKKLGIGAGIIFKGEGFYATDYRSEDYKKKAKEETSSTGSSDSTKNKTKDTTKETSGKKNSNN